MKRVFIIVGPESSGTRVVTRLFCMAGCVGDYEHEQRLDKFVYENDVGIDETLGEGHETIVLRRSIPHYPDKRPDILGIGAMFQEAGYEPYYVVTMRDWTCNALSKVVAGHCPAWPEAKECLTKEWADIGSIFAGFDGNFCVVLTSHLFVDPERTLSGLEGWLGLSFPKNAFKIVFDADGKYYSKDQKNANA